MRNGVTVDPAGSTAVEFEPYASLVETHSGVVILLGDTAFKVKKPVRFGFLDFTTEEARRAACHREVALNRRLAPDVYLGVADVVGPDGRPVDHLVMMRRLPGDRRLSALARSGVPVDDHIRRLAHLIGAFHQRAETSNAIAQAASRDAMAARWEANRSELVRFVGPVLDPQRFERVFMLASRYLDGRSHLFAERIEAGRARDGHGDLLADDIFCLDDGPRVLDCLEFDDTLRWGDVLSDVSFLAMDLERLGRDDLARSFLSHYRECTADNWPASLAHHHIAHRALVRCKVACLRWEQGDVASATDATGLLELACGHLERARVRMVLIGGLPGTGKSTLGAGLAEGLDAVVLRSDEIRKQLAGLDTTAPAPAANGSGIYRPSMTAETYATLLERARQCLRSGVSVVLDATWTDGVLRERARAVAGETVADLSELHCVLPADVAADRMQARAAVGGDASDATASVARAMATTEAPWPTATEIDTSTDRASVLRVARAVIT